MKGTMQKIEENIYKQDNGRYRVEMNFLNPTTNKKDKRRKVFNSIREARKFRDEFRAKRTLHQLPKGLLKKFTLGNMIDLVKEQKKELKTFDDILRHLDDIKSYFGAEKALIKIDHASIKGLTHFLKQRKKKGRHKGKLSNQSIDHVLKELRYLLRQAKERNLIDKVPKIKFLGNYGHRDFNLTLDEFMKVIEHLPKTPSPHRAILLMAMNTGQRKGDLSKMTWDQIKERHIEYRSTKTQRDGIHAPLMDVTKMALEALRKHASSSYIFVNPRTGEPLKSMRKALHSACDNAGVKRFSMHHLRHLATTVLLELTNGDRDLVKRIVGWSDMAMVDRYGHIGDRAIVPFEKLNQRLTNGLANAS